jgi:hypothetical protein
VSRDGVIIRALRAICLTRDYVGQDKLPAIDGWEWYEAGKLLCDALPKGKWVNQFRLRVEADRRMRE